MRSQTRFGLMKHPHLLVLIALLNLAPAVIGAVQQPEQWLPVAVFSVVVLCNTFVWIFWLSRSGSARSRLLTVLFSWGFSVAYTALFSSMYSNAYLIFVLTAQLIFLLMGPRYGAFMLVLTLVAELYHFFAGGEVRLLENIFVLTVQATVGVVSWLFVSAAEEFARKAEQAVAEASTARARAELLAEEAAVARQATEQAAAALRENEARLRLLTEQMPALLWSTDADLRFTSVTGRALVTLDVRPGSLDGASAAGFFATGSTEPLSPSALARALQGESITYETSISGREFQVYVEPLCGAEGTIVGTLGVAAEITELKRIEEERRAKEAAEEANRAKSEFLSRMSHELRTPLNAILGFAQLLDLENLTGDQRESVDMILKAGWNQLKLIDELLDISRIESGRLHLSLEPVPLDETLRECLDLVQPLASGRGLQLVADIRRGSDEHVRADRQRLKQVFLNLLTNAIKYNHEGGSVMLSWARVGDGRVRVNVRDTGMGIAPARLSSLFTPFERLGVEHTGVEGTGLGLALSRRLVEAMGGAIGVESQVGTGTVFWVELDAVDDALPLLRTRLTGPLLPEQLSAAQTTILYIEDNPSNLRLVERLLRQWPEARLVSAMRGSLGLELAREHHPDLILLDLHLPDMPGEEVLERLLAQRETSAIPVIIISADASPGQAERLLATGARAYLTKPIDVPRLVRALEETLWQPAVRTIE